MSIQVIIGGSAFIATLDEGAAGQELARRLPLSLTMEELHGNEKYCYTGQDFGGNASVPDAIHAGDLMAFGGDCLVLFYEEIPSNSWSYARIGRIEDTSGLAQACGTGAVSVEFRAL
ncbi:MAG: cyclophilin-like fold protein [Coriobacteriales bacterium]|nr:cyclophilin-like fold protein [Coriobacteriales bacterium]